MNRPLLLLALLVLVSCRTPVPDAELSARVGSLEGQLAVAQGRADAAEKTVEELRAELRRAIDAPPCEPVGNDSGGRSVDDEELRILRAEKARLEAELENVSRTLQNLGGAPARGEALRPQAPRQIRVDPEVAMVAGPLIRQGSSLERFVVHGTLRNAGTVFAQGSVSVQLIDGEGRTVGSGSASYEIAAGQEVRYEIEIQPWSFQPPLSATAEWVGR